MTRLYGIWVTRKDTDDCWLSLYNGAVFTTGHISRAEAQLLTVMAGRELPLREEPTAPGEKGHIVTGLEVRQIGEDGRPVDEAD